jgi:hypothetical protein
MSNLGSIPEKLIACPLTSADGPPYSFAILSRIPRIPRLNLRDSLLGGQCYLRTPKAFS